MKSDKNKVTCCSTKGVLKTPTREEKEMWEIKWKLRRKAHYLCLNKKPKYMKGGISKKSIKTQKQKTGKGDDQMKVGKKRKKRDV